MNIELLIPILLFIICIVLTKFIYIPNKIIALFYILITIYYTNIYIGYGFIFVVLFVLYNGINRNPIKEYFDNNKPRIIPLDIYQTWSTKDMPLNMKDCVQKLQNYNPEFKHHLYDDNDCRNFIKNHFENDVLYAYDNLIPTAYKADLWRYCILYKKGGIYLDIKFQCEDNFKLVEMTDQEYFVLDRPYVDVNMSLDENILLVNNKNYYDKVYNNIDTQFWKNKEIGLYNAVIACKPGNIVLLDCIKQIVQNVNTKYYGHNSLYPTGPGLLAEKYYHRYGKESVNNFKYFNSLHGSYIIDKNKKCLSHYPQYRLEQYNESKNTKKEHYHDLWKKKQIYANE
jgi:mannosyltransferase OCH1-like enzyme